jgi:hypothetical protein
MRSIIKHLFTRSSENSKFIVTLDTNYCSRAIVRSRVTINLLFPTFPDNKCILFNAKWAIFSARSLWEQVTFDEMMMMMSALYYTNTLSWIFIVLTHWNNSLRVRHVSLLGHIILISSQPVFAICMLSRETTNTNFIVFGFTRLLLEPTPLMRSR